MYPPDRIDDYRRRAQQRTIADALRPPRQPWDERTPGGQTVQELMRGSIPGIRPQGMPDLAARIESPMARIRSGNVPDAALQAPQAPPPQPSPRIAISSQPATGITGALNLPKPATEAQPITDVPQPNEPLTAAPPTSPVVGPSIRGMRQLDRNIMLREAMSNADPESRVRIAGDDIDISPPAMKGVGRRGRFSTAGEAGLNALGSGDPDRPLYSLGQGLGAAVTGLVSPRAGAKINRRFDISRLDSDIARGLQLETAQSGLASAEALRRQRELEPILEARKISSDIEYKNAQLELERQKAAGVIDQREYEQRRDQLNRESRERIAGMDRSSRERVAGMRSTSSGDEARAAKAAAAQAEYDQLVADEQNAKEEKDRAYAYLAQIKQGAGNRPRDLQDVKEAQDAAEAADKLYKGFGEKKREAQRRMRENQYSVAAPGTAGPPPAPPGVTEASIRAEAKRRGQDAEAAVMKAREFGWIQ